MVELKCSSACTLWHVLNNNLKSISYTTLYGWKPGLIAAQGYSDTVHALICEIPWIFGVMLTEIHFIQHFEELQC